MNRGRHLAAVVAVLVGMSGLALAGAPLASAAGYDVSAVDTRMLQATDGCAEICNVWFRVTREGTGGPGDDDILMDRRYGPTAVPNGLWWTASAGKWMSGVTIMTVVDDGLLSLDDTVAEFFPAYVGTPKGSMTVAQLMSHSSGLPGLDTGGFQGHACVPDSTTTLQACASGILADTALVYTPGTGFAYGQLSMQVAGAMAELATGKTWNQIYNENLATPLGITNMGWATNNPTLAGNTAPNGMRATLEDYDRVLEMLQHDGNFRGTQVLTPAAVQASETNRVAGLTIHYTPSPEMQGYGIGMWLEDLDAGGVASWVSSPGMFGTVPWIDRTRGYRGIFASMSNGPTARAVIDDVRPIITAQIDANPVGTPPPAPTPFPTVTSVAPGTGTTLGGETVVIQGTGFTNVLDVQFGGGNLAPSFTVNSPTQITATAPPRTAGLVNVRIRTLGGLSVANGSLAYYRYVDAVVPNVDSVAPSNGPSTGGQTVVITGTGFTSASVVEFGNGVPAPSFTVNSATQITAVTPARAPVLVNVFVTAPGGKSPAEPWISWYTFNAPGVAPDVDRITPASGPAAGGTAVTITGRGFTGATRVEFGTGVNATFVVVNDTTINATTPARAAALVNVFVTTPVGRSPAQTYESWFSYS